MTADALMKLLRAVVSFAIGWASAKGYLTPADAGLMMTLATQIGPIIVPMLMTTYSNWQMKSVPKDAIAVAPTAIDTGSTPHETIVTGKIVGGLLLALIVFSTVPAFAQQNVSAKSILIADLTAARDDAKSNDDPSEACWTMLLDHVNTMPPKIMGLAHGAQRLRDIRRGLPKVMETCAVVKDGARAAIVQIFALGASGAAGLAFFGL